MERLAGFLGGIDAGARSHELRPGDGPAIGKIVVVADGDPFSAQDDGPSRPIVTIHRDLIGGPRDCTEDHLAPEVRARVIVRGHLRQCADRVSRIDGQQRIEAAARGANGGVARSRSSPFPPDRGGAGVARMVRLAGFLGGLHAGAGSREPAPCQRPAVGEIIVGNHRRALSAESHRARGTAMPIHRDAIGDAQDGGECDPARRLPARIVVAGDEREAAHGRAGIDGQQRVEAAARSRDRRRPGDRRGPLPPDRSATRVARVVGFTGFPGGVEIRAAHDEAAPGKRARIGKLVVPRAAAGGQRPGEIQASAAHAFAGEGGQTIRAIEQPLDELDVEVARVVRAEQRERPRDVGSRHGSPRQRRVGGVARVEGGDDLRAGAREIHGRRSEVRERRERIQARRTGHRHHIILRIARGIRRCRVVVRGAVPRRGDEEYPRAARRRDRVAHRLRKASPTPAIAHDMRPFPDRVVDALQGIRDEPRAVAVEEFASHQLHPPRDPRDPLAVVADGAHRPGDMGAVAVVIRRVATAGDGVESVDVVDDPVPIVIHAVPGDLIGVAPHIQRQILVRVADAGIDHRDDDVLRAVARVPRFRRIDVGVASAGGLPRVVEPPERAVVETGIVRIADGTHHVVRLGEDHGPAGLELSDGGRDRPTLRQLQHLHAAEPVVSPQRPRPHLPAQSRRLRRRARGLLEPHQHPPRMQLGNRPQGEVPHSPQRERGKNL